MVLYMIIANFYVTFVLMLYLTYMKQTLQYEERLKINLNKSNSVKHG
jgi:hypothetical protein